jgi:hypothetical protein
VIAHGYANPASLVWNTGTGELWLTGNDPRLPSPVSVLRVDVDRRAVWPRVPSPVNVATVSSRFASLAAPVLAATPSSVATNMQQVWMVREDGVAQRIMRSSGRGALRLDGATIDQLGPLVALSQGPGDDLLLATQAPGREALVWRLTRRDTVR